MTLPRLAQSQERFWQFHVCYYCSDTFRPIPAPVDYASMARGFGPTTTPMAHRQRALLEVLDKHVHDYLAGGEAREIACAAVADVLLG